MSSEGSRSGDQGITAELADLADVWHRAINQLDDPTVRPHQRAWLSLTRPIGLLEDTALLAAPNTYAKEYLENYLRPLITRALSEALGRDINVAVTIQPMEPGDRPSAVVEEAEHAEDDSYDRFSDGRGESLLVSQVKGSTSEVFGSVPTPAMVRIDHEARLNPKYTFETFVPGSSNRLAHAAAVAVAEAPAKAYNPLFIYGESGLGKTHLLHAIGAYGRRLQPTMRVRYVSSEEFTNDFINSVRVNDMQSFQRRYRDVDLLLIDDIQFLERAEQTQEAFFHTFNTLQLANKQIVISCDRRPEQLSGLQNRLVTRFKSGLVADVQAPDLELRIAILRKKAAKDGMTLQPGVMEFIASKIQSNIRELEGALIRVVAFGSLNKQDIDLKLAEIVLKDLVGEPTIVEPTPEAILREAARFYSLAEADIIGLSRKRFVAEIRSIVMYLCRELTNQSLATIGELLQREATTVAHGDKEIRSRIKTDHRLAGHVAEIAQRARAQARQQQLAGPSEFVEAVLDSAARTGMSRGEVATMRYVMPDTADTYEQLGRIAFSRASYPQAESLYLKSLQILSAQDRRQDMANILSRLGFNAQANMDYASAEQYYERSLTLSTEVADSEAIAETLYRIGLLRRTQGKNADAEHLFREALASAEGSNNHLIQADILLRLGMLLEESGDVHNASELYSKSLGLARELGARPVQAETLRRLASLAQHRGELDEAVKFYQESLESLEDDPLATDANSAG